MPGGTASAWRTGMPIDPSYGTADCGQRQRPGVTVPGYWEAIRQRHIRTIKEGDPRAVECGPAASRRLEASPHSVTSMARATLAQMDETGGPVVTWPPPNRDCERIL